MLKVWLIIISGVLFFPILSSTIRALEESLYVKETEKGALDDKKKKAIEKKIKFLTYGTIVAFILIVVLMIIFSRGISLGDK